MIDSGQFKKDGTRAVLCVAVATARRSVFVGVPVRGLTAFTPEKEQAILNALELHPSISRACRTARVSRQTFYNWRKAHPEFAVKAETAREIGIDALEDSLFKDAIDSHNTTAAIFMLKSWRRERYGDKSELTHVGDDEHPVSVRLVRQ